MVFCWLRPEGYSPQRVWRRVSGKDGWLPWVVLRRRASDLGYVGPPICLMLLVEALANANADMGDFSDSFAAEAAIASLRINRH